MAEKAETPDYLKPYFRAISRHGASIRGLLWASDETQTVRFDALQRALVKGWHVGGMRGRTVLDVGCGRGDLLLWARQQNIAPAEYIGVDASAELLSAARERCGPAGLFIEADVVARPAVMFTGSEVVAVSGTLNTLAAGDFVSVLGRLMDAAAEVLVFNFLSSAERAAGKYLTWHGLEEVEKVVARHGGEVMTVLSDYLDGDTTMLVKPRTD
jgi:SAM-dependent methyltransferase